jgi:hypothetical protein
MEPTHVSLLDQAKTGTAGAWDRLVGLYLLLSEPEAPPDRAENPA